MLEEKKTKVPEVPPPGCNRAPGVGGGLGWTFMRDVPVQWVWASFRCLEAVYLIGPNTFLIKYGDCNKVCVQERRRRREPAND